MEKYKCNFKSKKEYLAADFVDLASDSPVTEGLPRPDVGGDALRSIVKREENRVYFAFAYFANSNHEEDLIFNLWQVAIVDAFYESLHCNLIKIAAAEGKELSPLYGPGYFSMPLAEAATVLEKAGAEEIGITVNEFSVMVPPVSRCGFFVLNSRKNAEYETQCEFCKGNKSSCSMCWIFADRSKNSS